MTESVGNNENLNDFGTNAIWTHFRLSALTVLKDKFDVYHQTFIFVIVYLLNEVFKNPINNLQELQQGRCQDVKCWPMFLII
jgi:hypothetical protein